MASTATEPARDVLADPRDGDPTSPRVAPGSARRVAVSAIVAAAAVALAVDGLRRSVDPGDRGRAVAGAIVVAWAVAAVVVALRRRTEPVSGWIALGSALGGLAFASAAAISDGSDAELVRAARAGALAGLPLVGLVLVLGLPDGRLRTRARRVLVAVGLVVVALAAVVVYDAGDDVPVRVPLVAASLFVPVGIAGYVDRCRRAGAVDRARLQWAGWGVVLAAAIGAAAWVLDALLGWPASPGAVALTATVLAPLSLALGSWDHVAVRVDRLLVRTVEVGGVVLMVGAIYLLVVLGFGDAPTDRDRDVLGLSMVAAAVAALLYGPTRDRLTDFANRRVYGARRAPDEALHTFGARMSRAIPLDELLLQLAESLKKSLLLSAAEVWTGSGGVLELSASVPDRRHARIALTPEEVRVVARAHVSGAAWMQVWLAGLVEGRDELILRVAPMTHSGELLGVILCARLSTGAPFTEEEDRVLAELSRQVALALRNSRLDTALQASLDEVRRQADELRASRARIVATADQSRRQIERNLHDGAQQHLVALAVKLALARQMLEADPDAVGPLLDDLRSDAQLTLTELRELAHGIYPPLLMDRGLPEALHAAANRATLPTDVDAAVGRFPSDVEAAVYFCCLEAMQNAGKYAGNAARVAISVTADERALRFVVADDGAGFDAGGDAVAGHGFVNMADRLGAIGGTLTIESARSRGTRVIGTIPRSW